MLVQFCCIFFIYFFFHTNIVICCISSQADHWPFVKRQYFRQLISPPSLCIYSSNNRDIKYCNIARKLLTPHSSPKYNIGVHLNIFVFHVRILGQACLSNKQLKGKKNIQTTNSLCHFLSFILYWWPNSDCSTVFFVTLI